MLSLLMDTSTERGCLAFFEREEMIFQGQLPYGLNNSKYLLPEIERGFKTLGKTPQDLNYVSLGIGPGSYTGIRVAAMVAKTLVFALKKPLITFCSMESFLPSKEGSFAVILDAKIGGAYVMKGQPPANPEIMALNELGDYLKDVHILVSPNISRIRPKLEEFYPLHSWIWEETEVNLAHLGSLTYTKFKKGDYSDGRELKLLYLRKTQAEMEKEGIN